MKIRIKRSIIIGAGASFPYGLPLAGKLLQDSTKRILVLDRHRAEISRGPYAPSPYETAKGDELNEGIIRSIKHPLTLATIARSFREHLVQQNLDDFVRDHPSLTDVVSMLITVSLFSAMYARPSVTWELKSSLLKSNLDIEKDWMRRFVGIVRPMASAENKLSIISFNYDSLLERSMRMYWSGSEREYAKMTESVEFIYLR